MNPKCKCALWCLHSHLNPLLSEVKIRVERDEEGKWLVVCGVWRTRLSGRGWVSGSGTVRGLGRRRWRQRRSIVAAPRRSATSLIERRDATTVRQVGTAISGHRPPRTAYLNSVPTCRPRELTDRVANLVSRPLLCCWAIYSVAENSSTPVEFVPAIFSC